MKKFLTLVAAALMAVGVNAQTEDVIKVSSGNSDWGQMFVNDGVAFEWPGRTFESTDKLTAKALYAGCNLKDSEDKDLTYARESGSVQTYTIEFGATPTVKMQICVNCIIPNQYGGGHSTMKFKPLTIVDNKASFTVSKEDCSFTGWSYKKVVEGETEKWIEDKEYKNVPQDVTSIVLQACDANATYPAVINIKSIKRVTTTATDIPRYTLDLANLDFSNEDAQAIGGWGGNFHSEINKEDGVDVITFTKQEYPHNVQVDFENVYPNGAKIRLTMVAKGSAEGSINAVLQNPDNYHECSKYEDINLTTDGFQSIEKTFTCSGDNARRLLLNVGNYDGEIYIKSVKIVALDVPEETVTISPSGYSTYAAYYPVDYSKLDLEAYAVKLNTDKKTITLKKIEEGVVPAGKAVLLKGTPGKSYELTIGEGDEAKFDTDLKVSDGTATSTAETAVYGLATVNDQDGFYKASDGKKIPAKCAYLEVANSASSVKCFSLGDHSGSTTGITSVKNEAAGNNAPMYNLAGQLVDKGYKGIVIKNGKKIVLK